ncbi:hypothetical protein EBR04_01750, partial [bacterium]|nr:hypothetical protein [bacterium]
MPGQAGGRRQPITEGQVVPGGDDRRARARIAGFNARRDRIGAELRIHRGRREQHLHRADAHGPHLAQAADRRPPPLHVARRVGDQLRDLRLERPQLVGAGELDAEREIAALHAFPEKCTGSLGDDRFDAGVRQARAKREQRLERRGPRRGIDRQPFERDGHLRHVGQGGKRANFRRVEGPLDLRQQLHDSQRRGLGFEGERREQPVFDRQFPAGRRREKRRHGGWMPFQGPAGEIPLEVAVVDRPGIALRPLLPQAHDERDRLGRGDRNPAERIAERRPHPRRWVGHQRRGQTAKDGFRAGRPGDPNRLVPEVGARVGHEFLEERQRHRAEAFERPEAAHSGGDRLGGVGRLLFQHGHERRRLAIDDLLPGEVGDPGVRRAEMLGQFVRRQFRHGQRLPHRLRRMPNPPDTAALPVAVGMVPRHLVVRDDLVVPIDHVEAAVGAELDRDRAKRLVGA